MVFSSTPAYIDPPNWQQRSHQVFGSGNRPSLAQPAQPAPPTSPPHQANGGVRGGSIWPGSMSERARIANIPMPETALRCPRCESTNTKFCYFNNYSLSQPRHFCKTCRRYWTRGGALRNVPVGGGCRRNKRSKPNSSKSPATNGDRPGSISSPAVISTSGGETNNLSGLTPQILPPLRFLSPLSQFTDNFCNEMGLNFTGISAPLVSSNDQMYFNSEGPGVASLFSNCSNDTWKLHHFSFLNGVDTSPGGNFPFQGGEPGFMGAEITQSDHLKHKVAVSTLNQPSSSIKMEENANQLHLSMHNFGGIQGKPDQTWPPSSAAATAVPWTRLSSFSSSTDNNPL